MELSAEHRALAGKIASSWVRRLPPSVRAENVRQAALVGLWDALRLDPAATTYYLKLRIRGAIVDELRQHDWLKRGARKRGEQVTLVQYDREDDLEALLGDGARAPEPSPEAAAIRKQTLTQALGPLRAIDRRIIHGSFFHDTNHRDLARALGLSPSRIGQRAAIALEAMRCTVTA